MMPVGRCTCSAEGGDCQGSGRSAASLMEFAATDAVRKVCGGDGQSASPAAASPAIASTATATPPSHGLTDFAPGPRTPAAGPTPPAPIPDGIGTSWAAGATA